METTEPLLNVSKPSKLCYNLVDTLIIAILAFLIINVVNRTGDDTYGTSEKKLNPVIYASITFCILELFVLLVAKTVIQRAKEENDTDLSFGFIIFIISMLFFIIETSTYYNQNMYIDDEYWNYKIKTNVYQVCIEVILRVMVFLCLLFLITKKWIII